MEKKNYYLDSRIEAVEDLKKVLEYERIRSVGITEKRFTREEFEDCPRFMPIERDENYRLFDIVDTERLDYVDFINPYSDINECNRDCNIMNIIDYLLKELEE